MKTFVKIGLALLVLLMCVTLAYAQGLEYKVYLPMVLRLVSFPLPTPILTLTSTPTPTPSSTPTFTVTPADPTATSTATATPTPTLTSTPACGCSTDLYNCSDFSTQTEARACFDYCWSLGMGDIHRLDADGDGIPCEGLPGVYLPNIYRDMRW